MVSHKLLASLVEPFLIEGHDLRVGASIGISVYPQAGHDAETLLRLADIAMYRAKQDGGGDAESVAFYSQDMNLGMQARMRLETGLRSDCAETGGQVNIAGQAAPARYAARAPGK